MNRVKAIKILPPPNLKNEIQYFMGKVNFLCIFIKYFYKINKPIHNLLMKYHIFKWGDTEK